MSPWPNLFGAASCAHWADLWGGCSVRHRRENAMVWCQSTLGLQPGEAPATGNKESNNNKARSVWGHHGNASGVGCKSPHVPISVHIDYFQVNSLQIWYCSCIWFIFNPSFSFPPKIMKVETNLWCSEIIFCLWTIPDVLFLHSVWRTQFAAIHFPWIVNDLFFKPQIHVESIFRADALKRRFHVCSLHQRTTNICWIKTRQMFFFLLCNSLEQLTNSVT